MLAVLLLNRMSAKRKRNVRVTKIVNKVKAERNENDLQCCRTCLSTNDLVDIFCLSKRETKIANDMKIITGLEIKHNDGLPQQMCSKCLDSLNHALQFRKTSRKSEKELHAMINGSKFKKKCSPKEDNVKVKKEVEPVQAVDNVECNNDFDDFDYGHNSLSQDIDCKEEQQDAQKAAPKKRRLKLSVPTSYKCTICDKDFRMNSTYRAHMRFHTNYCVCEACGKRCRNNNQLQEHKRARHGLGRIHKCAYCEYSSATKEALTIHERRHTGERPYICDHCGATFHRRSNLVQHIAIHLPEKNFQCQYCMKMEKSHKRLQIHISQRHRERKYRYLCPVCKKSFSRREHTKRHLRRTHGIAQHEKLTIDKFDAKSDFIQEC